MSNTHNTPKQFASRNILPKLSLTDWLSAIGLTILFVLTGYYLASQPSFDSLIAFIGILVQAVDFIRSISKPK